MSPHCLYIGLIYFISYAIRFPYLNWYQDFPSVLELRLIVTGLFPCLLEFIVELLGVRAMLVNQRGESESKFSLWLNCSLPHL